MEAGERDSRAAARELRIRGVLTGRKALVGPRIAYIDLTNRCANRCLYCWNRSPLLGEEAPPEAWFQQELALERVERLLEELTELGAEGIIYSGGGDPVFYPRLAEVIRKTRECGLVSYLVTSLIPAVWDRIEAWSAAGLNTLVVSIWAASEETYGKIHPGCPEGHFTRLRELFLRMAEERKRRPFPRLNFIHVISSLNVAEIDLMVEMARESEAEEVWFNLLDPAFEALRPLLLSPSGVARARRTFTRLQETEASRGDAKPDLGSAEYMVEKLSSSGVLEGRYHTDVIDSIPCTVGWLEVRVLADGTVCPCCKGDRFPLGNIHEKSFRDIWFSETYDRFREKALTTSKHDAYFRLIDCAKGCDNWCHIRNMYRALQAHPSFGLLRDALGGANSTLLETKDAKHG